MSSKRAVLGVLLAMAISGVGISQARAADLSDAIERRIDAVVTERISASKSAGIVVEVMQAGRILHAKGYGKANLENDVPMTLQSVLRIASVTKQFTAAAMLILVERRKVSLEDPLSKYLPDFPRGTEVTIRQLLNHTSGIHNYTEIGNRKVDRGGFRRDVSPEEMLDFIKGFEPLYDFAPGSAWHYSNSGYYLAGMIIEKVSGQTLGIFMRDNLFSRVRMDHTSADDAADVVPHRASGYQIDASRPSGFRNAEYMSMTIAGAAGFLRSTADDLAKWHDALFSAKVIGQPLLEEMISPGRLKNGRIATTHQVPPDDYDTMARGAYGFGLNIAEVSGHKRVGHDGDIPGFQAALYTYLDAKLTVVVLCNTNDAGANELGAQIAAIVLKGASSTGN